MFIHFHSLFAGLIVLAVLLLLRLPVAFGMLIVPICLLVDSGQFLSRLKRDRQAWSYALISLIQSIGIYGMFALIWTLIFRGES